MNEWTLEIYFIGMPRSDGKPPSFEKAWCNKIFEYRESAEANLQYCLGDGWRVYSAIVTVPWSQA